MVGLAGLYWYDPLNGHGAACALAPTSRIVEAIVIERSERIFCILAPFITVLG